MTQPELLAIEPPPAGRFAVPLRSPSLRYVAGVLGLALAYYCAAKLGQSLRYTASVAAIWPCAMATLASGTSAARKARASAMSSMRGQT